jgi:hypothetical protein
MSNMKDGKVALSDREKYRQMATSTGSILTVPEVLEKAFKESDLVCKWVSKTKMVSHGGYHPSGWIPYDISAEQKAKLPKQFMGSIVLDRLERGDLILAVKPREMQEDHKKDIRRKTRQQLDSLYQEKDADGNSILVQPE